MTKRGKGSNPALRGNNNAAGPHKKAQKGLGMRVLHGLGKAINNAYEAHKQRERDELLIAPFKLAQHQLKKAEAHDAKVRERAHNIAMSRMFKQ
jgi:hypothetical protein